MTENNRTDPRTKHIDVKYHYTREQVANKVVKFAPIPTAMMVADALTKPCPIPKFKWCRDHMGIKDISDPMLPTSVRGGVSRCQAKVGVHDKWVHGNLAPVVLGHEPQATSSSVPELLLHTETQ